MILADIYEPDELKQIADDVEDLGFDYLVVGVEKTYVIERKSIVDLLGSIRGKSGQDKVKNRFVEQLRRIILVCEDLRKEGNDAIPILIVEGNHFKRYKARYARMTPPQWMGIQAKVAEMGIGLIRTWSMDETKIALHVLNKRAGKGDVEIPQLAINKGLRDVRVEAANVLMAISGIGEKTATRLLNRFGSVERVLMASEDELMNVVSEKIAKHIKEVIRYRYNNTKRLGGD